MTQVEVTDGDIAEALRLIPNLVCLTVEQVREEEWAGILAHAKTIAKMRVAIEALEPFATAGRVKLCGGDYWTPDKSIQGTDVAFHITFGDLAQAIAALAQITQETPNAG